MHQKHYSRFLHSLGEKLHFAAHSHHAWPDVSRDAHLQYWDDSARLWDEKWEHVFAAIIPEAQKRIAQMLHLRDEQQIVFAPNTHELVSRLLSTLEPKQPIRVLTTENEFHSFRRQIHRMEEAGIAEVTYLHADQLGKLRKSFLELTKQKLMSGHFDFFFMSQVFFDSGLALTTHEIEEIVFAAPPHTVICIDGYHAFAALPVDLSRLEGRIFYLAGGYKYAQAGEGACFMVVPKGDWRPMNTGWFAEMSSLSGTKSPYIQYARDGSAFFGSTQDFSGLYRFNAVWKFFEKEGITISKIHDHVMKLQAVFLDHLPKLPLARYSLLNANHERGHFLTFDLGSPAHCAEVHDALKKNGVLTDFRGQRLRIGFGLYQTENDVLKLISKCNVVAAVNH